jgi:RHS repeat-associated protein
VERYSYTAYGTLGIYDAVGTVRTTSTYANRYTYTGREYDADLNLYHFRARWYDPSTGGFISRDPLGYVDGMSLYRGYFAVKRLDPYGSLSVVLDQTNGSGGIVSVKVPDVQSGTGGVVSVQVPYEPTTVTEPRHCVKCRPCIGNSRNDYVVTVISRYENKDDFEYWGRTDFFLMDFFESRFGRMVRLDVNDHFLNTDDGIPDEQPDGCLIGRRVYEKIENCVDFEYPCINELNLSGHGGGNGGVRFNAKQALDLHRRTFWEKTSKLLCKNATINFFSCGSGKPEYLQPIANITRAKVCGCADYSCWAYPHTCNNWVCAIPITGSSAGPQIIAKAVDE